MTHCDRCGRPLKIRDVLRGLGRRGTASFHITNSLGEARPREGRWLCAHCERRASHDAREPTESAPAEK